MCCITFLCVSDLLFGVPGKYTGVSHYNRKRVVSYTITVVLVNYDARFVACTVEENYSSGRPATETIMFVFKQRVLSVLYVDVFL